MKLYINLVKSRTAAAALCPLTADHRKVTFSANTQLTVATEGRLLHIITARQLHKAIKALHIKDIRTKKYKLQVSSRQSTGQHMLIHK